MAAKKTKSAEAAPKRQKPANVVKTKNGSITFEVKQGSISFERKK